MVEPLAYSVEDAAAAVGVGRDVIYRAIRSKDLPARYPTKKAVILRADLEAWLAAAPTERAS